MGWGCYPPLAKFVSKALGKCNGSERWRKERLDYAMAYPPGPPMETHYMPPVARAVTFASNNNVYVIPPQKPPPPSPPPQQEQKQQSAPEPPPQQPQTPPQQPEPDHHDSPPRPQPEPEPEPEPEPPAPAQEKAPDAPPAAEPKPSKAPKRGKNKKPGGRVRFGPDPPPPQYQQPQQEPDHGKAPGHQGQQHGHGGGPQQGPAVPAYLFRYTPSPLPRWEATPRRHEYFSGEYRSYYPTPVREGIYRIATDANRLTTIFSEENPNACAIV